MSEKQQIEADVSHVEANGNFERSWREEKWGDRRLSVIAQDVALEEKEMTIRQAVKVYKKAIMWCLAISCVVIMEGYDTNLLGNFYAYRTSHPIHEATSPLIALASFQRRFGDKVPVTEQTPQGYSLGAAWQTGLGQGSSTYPHLNRCIPC